MRHLKIGPVNDENVLLANKFVTTALSQTSCRKLKDCVKVLRGKNKKYTRNLRAEILWQTLLRLFGISLTNILLGTSPSIAKFSRCPFHLMEFG